MSQLKYAELKRERKVDPNLLTSKIIRLRQNENSWIYQKYKESKFPVNYTHFNLQVSRFEVGHLYIMPMIIQPGYLTETEEVFPKLDFTNAYVGECVSVRERIPYSRLTEEELKNSAYSDLSELRLGMLKKYSQSMPKLSEKDIIDLGVSKTDLKIIGFFW